MKPVFCLVGPTCTGKSDIAIELASKLPLEIISVDSAMVYRGLDIGTAKPPHIIREKIPHHLMDILDPKHSYNAADFRRDAFKFIDEIFSRKKFPLLVGGSMLYFKVLSKGLSPLPSASSTIRDQLQRNAKQNGWQSLHKKLEQIDPESAKRIHPNDPQRLLRALEVFYISGKTLTGLHKQSIKSSIDKKEYNVSCDLPYNIEWIGLMPHNRQLLHDVIQKRFLTMLNDGLLNEVKTLFNRGDLHAQLPAIKSVGYRQIWQFLTNELTYEQMIERAVIATRQLAKHQMTWIRNWPETIYQINSQANNKLALIENRIQSIMNQV